MCLCPIDAWRLTEDFEDLMTTETRASYIMPQLTNGWLPRLLFTYNFKKLPSWIKGYYEHIIVPCGKCIECRLKHSKQWSLRCMHEAEQHQEKCFITITYNEESVPKENGVNTLRYSDFQKFMKSLRTWLNRTKERFCKMYNLPYDKEKDYISIRYFVSSEYGTRTHRPHYHAIIYGWQPRPKQLVLWNRGKSGLPNYRCFPLERFCWKNKGMITVGTVTRASAGYIARYTTEKLEVRPDDFYINHEKEHLCMSRRNGLGYEYVKKYYENISRLGYIMYDEGNHNLKRYSIPRYYRKYIKEHYPDLYENLKLLLKTRAIAYEEQFNADLELSPYPLYKVRDSKYEYFRHVIRRLKRSFSTALIKLTS